MTMTKTKTRKRRRAGPSLPERCGAHPQKTLPPLLLLLLLAVGTTVGPTKGELEGWKTMPPLVCEPRKGRACLLC